MIIIEKPQDPKKKVETYADLEAGETFEFSNKPSPGEGIKMKLETGCFAWLDGPCKGRVSLNGIDEYGHFNVTRVTIRGTAEYHR